MPLWLTGKFIVYALIALAVMGAIGTGVYKVKQWGASEVQMRWDKAVSDQIKEDQKRAMLAAQHREQDRAKSKVVYRTIKEKVVEYIDRPIYSTVCVDPDGMYDINSALLGTVTPPSGTSGRVPPVTTPDR